MKLQEIGFPYKKYNNKFIDRRMDEIVTYHKDNVKQATPNMFYFTNRRFVTIYQRQVCLENMTNEMIT